MQSPAIDLLYKKANCLLLSTHVFADDTPQEVSFFKHPLLLEHPQEDKQFVQLAYGINASNECAYLANQYADRVGKRHWSLRLRFELRGVLTKATLTKEAVRLNGFLHVRRLQKSFRNELLEEVLEFLRPLVKAALLTKLRMCGLDKILARFPKAVVHLMNTHPEIDVLVHEAKVTYAEDRGLVQVATIRKARARLMPAMIRYEEGIPVRFGT